MCVNTRKEHQSMDNENQKPRKKKKSSIPIYAVGLVWISYAIE